MSKSKIDHNAVQALLLSIDVQDFLYDTAKDLVGNDNRYSITRDTDNTERTSVTIEDPNPGAIGNEIRTGRLGRIAKGNK